LVDELSARSVNVSVTYRVVRRLDALVVRHEEHLLADLQGVLEVHATAGGRTPEPVEPAVQRPVAGRRPDVPLARGQRRVARRAEHFASVAQRSFK
jgi:hypothetical protein